MRRPLFLVFVVLAALETGTLAVLVVNLATVHDPALARGIGPVHGAVYLVIALLALLAPDLRWQLRVLGLIPIVGGVLAVRLMRPRSTDGPRPRRPVV